MLFDGPDVFIGGAGAHGGDAGESEFLFEVIVKMGAGVSEDLFLEGVEPEVFDEIVRVEVEVVEFAAAGYDAGEDSLDFIELGSQGPAGEGYVVDSDGVVAAGFDEGDRVEGFGVGLGGELIDEVLEAFYIIWSLVDAKFGQQGVDIQVERNVFQDFHIAIFTKTK